MRNNEPIRLLVAMEDKSESSRLISMLEASNLSIEPIIADSIDVIEKLIADLNFDLLILSSDAEETPFIEAATKVRKSKKAFPKILLCPDYEHAKLAPQAFKAGFEDVIPFDHDQHLVAAVNREYAGQLIREQLRQSQFSEERAKATAQALLDDTRTPTAYLQDGMFVFFNQAFREVLGYHDEDDLLIQPLSEIIKERDLVKEISKVDTGDGSDKPKKFEATLVNKSGNELPAGITVKATRYDDEDCNELSIPSMKLSVSSGNSSTAVAAGAGVATHGNKLNDKLEFISLAQQAIDDVHQNMARQLTWFQAVDFRSACEHLTLTQRDDLLNQVANYLHEQGQSLGEWSDLGNGHFVLISQCKRDVEAEELLEPFIKQLDTVIWQIEDQSTRLHLRAGITRIGTTNKGAEELLQFAESAWLECKEKNLLTSVSEQNQTEDEVETTEDIIDKLKSALTNNRFKLLFQPVINLHGNQFEVYEVLLRLIDDSGEEISPAKWTEEVKVTELGSTIDRWVIREAAKQLAAHTDGGQRTKLLINLNEQSITDSGLASYLEGIINAAKLPRDALVLQMSEHDVNKHLKPAEQLTSALAAKQCKTSLCHFGANLSPFETLNMLSVSWVKVDGSFTKSLQESGSTDNLKEVLEKLTECGKDSIVPMVENAASMNKLWMAGASYIQGYYILPPSHTMGHNFELN